MYHIMAKEPISHSITLSGWMQAEARTAVLCEKGAVADIAVAAAVTRRLRAVFYLTDRERLLPGVLASMKVAGVRNVVIVGGERTVSGNVEKALAKEFAVLRIAGNSRFETAREAVRFLKRTTDLSQIVVVRITVQAEQLKLGAMAARLGAAILWEEEKSEAFLREEGLSRVSAVSASPPLNAVVISDTLLLRCPAAAVFAGVKNAQILEMVPSNAGTVYRMTAPVSILLDPGHAKGINAYVIRNATEGEVMFRYAQVLGEKLRAAGWQVGYTRKRAEENPSLTARGRMGLGYDLLLSLHSNAMPGQQPNVRGTEVFDSVRAPNPKLAGALSHAIATVFDHPNRGVKYRRQEDGRDWYGILRESRAAHSFLIEHGFHTNPVDAAIMMDKQEPIADRTVEVLRAYYGW